MSVLCLPIGDIRSAAGITSYCQRSRLHNVDHHWGCQGGHASAADARRHMLARPASRPIPSGRLSASRVPPHSLLKLEDKLVDRLAGRWLDREVAGVLGMAPEIALRDELEAGRFNFSPQRSLFDP